MVGMQYKHEVITSKLPRAEKWKKRSLDRIKRIVIHRNSIAFTPWKVASWYINEKGWPGHPYHFHILKLSLTEDKDDHDIKIYQCNYLGDLTWGVRGYNTTSIHIAVGGDFREKAPSLELFDGAAALVCDLLRFGKWSGKELVVKSHTETTWWPGKKIRTKQCPGKMWNMDRFRTLVMSGGGITVRPVKAPWWLP